ncbi:hypothetical protein Dimus_015104 [Dionaea muscipula]
MFARAARGRARLRKDAQTYAERCTRRCTLNVVARPTLPAAMPLPAGVLLAATLLNVSLFHTWGYSNGKLDAWLLVIRQRRDVTGRTHCCSLRPAARWPHAEASLLATVVLTTMEVASNVKEPLPWKPELLAPKLRRSPAMAARRAPATSRLSLLAGRTRCSPSSVLAGCCSCSLFERKVSAMSTARKLELLDIISAARWGVIVRRLEVSSSKANELSACICCSRVVNEVPA